MPAPSGYPTSTVPDWATNPGTRTTPPAGLQATGWVPGTVLPAGTGNGLWGPLADWCGYLQASSPSLGTWDVVDVNVWSGATQYGDLTTATVAGSTMIILRSQAAAAGLAIGCLGGDRTTLLLDATTDTMTAFDVTSGDNHWQSTAAGGFIGPRASADGATGLRYGYPAADPLVITRDASPGSGGWTVSRQDVIAVNLIAGIWWLDNLDAGSAQPATAVWSLDLTGTSEPAGAPLQVVSLSGDFASLTNTDVTIELIEHHRSTGATTALLSITSSGATVTDNNGGVAQDLDPLTYRYYLQLTTVGNIPASGSTVEVEQVTMVFNKFCVE